MTIRAIRLGTRGSALALAQARLVATALEQVGHLVTLAVIETDGDRRVPDTQWGEGAFVAAIQTALLDGRADAAVHSAKDVPIDRDKRLMTAAYLRRADPRDALVIRADIAARRLADLPAGSRVGTDSPRRTGFIRALRPDLDIHPLHGNVDTRLRRLDRGETDALVLACAGLDRLAHADRIAERFDPAVVPPAPGQGAIAVEIRTGDLSVRDAVAKIDDRPTRLAVEAERAFLEATGGGCRAPVGAFASVDRDRIDLLAGCVDPSGSDVRLGRRHGKSSRGAALGRQVARELQGGTVGRPDPSVERRSRVIVTRAAAQSAALAEQLHAAGVQPVFVPAIAVENDRDGQLVTHAAAFRSYRWVVVTSANGVRAVLDAVAAAGTDPRAASWAVIGRATADRLADAGIAAAFRPTRAAADALAAELPIDRGDHVLVARGDLAGEHVASQLRRRGAVVDDVVAYQTIEAPPGSTDALVAAMDAGPIDAVLFTSGSTVRGFVVIGDRARHDVTGIPAVCIGRETAAAARAAGFQILATAPRQDATALAATTAAALTGHVREVA